MAGAKAKSVTNNLPILSVFIIASVLLKLSGCDRSLSHGTQDFLFASSFKSFGRASACAAFKCACKTSVI